MGMHIAHYFVLLQEKYEQSISPNKENCPALANKIPLSPDIQHLFYIFPPNVCDIKNTASPARIQNTPSATKEDRNSLFQGHYPRLRRWEEIKYRYLHSLILQIYFSSQAMIQIFNRIEATKLKWKEQLEQGTYKYHPPTQKHYVGWFMKQYERNIVENDIFSPYFHNLFNDLVDTWWKSYGKHLLGKGWMHHDGKIHKDLGKRRGLCGGN